MTWEGAQLYCQAQGKRLPTEAEWEYAARGAHGWRFPWGSEEPSCEGVVFARRPNYACAQLQTGPSDVGHAAQDRSPQGVRDLAGNVAEWVSDSYVEHYPVCDAPCVDPWVETPDARATQAARVIRGGDYNVAAPLTRAAWRGRWPHDYSTGNIGFRCARSAAR